MPDKKYLPELEEDNDNLTLASMEEYTSIFYNEEEARQELAHLQEIERDLHIQF